MSEVKVNKISPRSGTTVTLGDSGDTIAINSGASLTGFTSTGIDDNATSTAITIDSSENVGIGTGSPSQALDVVGSIEVSGNIYLGGTGSANALDDYETGTWTPVYGGGTTAPTVTYGLQSGTYTKIGRIVIVVCNIRGQATAQGSGYLRIEGLPFPAKSSPSAYSGIGVAGYAINWNADNAPTRGLVSAGLSFITLRTFSTDDPRDELAVTVDAGNLATSSTGDNSVQVTVTYETA